MPSHADVRVPAEWACRIGALGLLAWSLWAAASPTGRGPTDVTTEATALPAAGDTAEVTDRLIAWSRRADLTQLHVTLDAAPDARMRDWLRALDGAGTAVAWSGDVPATAIVAERVAGPDGGVQVAVAAPDRMSVVITDAGGRIDSLAALGGGGSTRAATLVGDVTMRTGASTARAAHPRSRVTRGVVLIGMAGWEAKFVAAALEERGWPVTVRLRVAPGLSVGSPATLDTSRTAAVIALDSTAASDAGAIAAFVRSGGGLVLGPEASRAPALATLAPARAGARIPAATTFAATVAPVTRETLARAPLVALRPDAVALERRADTVLVAARRVEAGRVVQVGYGDTWRWRMAGADESPAAHRAWWSQVVEAAAYAPVAAHSGGTVEEPATSLPGNPPGASLSGDPPGTSLAADPAPRAALVAALGDASVAPATWSDGAAIDPSRSVWVYISAALLLLAEWASRRLRGAR